MRSAALERSGVDALQALLSAIVESSDDAIVSKTLDGVITSWNRAAEEMFGYSAAEAVGQSVRLIIPPDRQAEEDYVLSRIRRGEKVYHFETIRQTKDGRRLNISLTVSPIRDAAGQIIGASKISRDISETKRLQHQTEELLRSERAARQELTQALAARDEFVAVAAHELRNPLHVFRLTLELLRRVAGEPSRAAQMTALIEKSDAHLGRLTSLVNSLLDVTRLRAGGLELYRDPFDLSRLLDHVVARFAGDYPAGIAVDAEPDIEGNWDQIRIDQAITNLIDNAIKYGSHNPILVTAHRTNEEALVSVRDEGIGISPENLSKIFEQFERLRSREGIEGWGLGLWITRKIVEAHGGAVSAESSIGKGSVFTIKLPL